MSNTNKRNFVKGNSVVNATTNSSIKWHYGTDVIVAGGGNGGLTQPPRILKNILC